MEARKFKNRMSANLVSGKDSLPGLQTVAFLLCAHMVFPECYMPGKRGQGISFSSCKATNSIKLGPHPMTLFHPNYHQEAQSPDTVIGGRGFNMNFKGDTIQSIALGNLIL